MNVVEWITNWIKETHSSKARNNQRKTSKYYKNLSIIDNCQTTLCGIKI
jgi:hypothetical protein